MDALRLLGQVMNSGALGSGGGGGGGAGGLLGGLLGGGGSGGAAGALGGLLGGGASAGGGLGGLLGGGGGGGLGGLLGGALGGRSSGGGMGKKAVMGALGGLAVAALMKHMKAKGQQAELERAGVNEMPDLGVSESEANSQAALLIRAMLGAAKADGRIDKDEESRLMERLGDLDRDEQEFLRAELQREADPQALARDVPRGMEQEVYAMSLMGITLDDKAEAQYLLELAQALDLSGGTCNEIHEQLGAPKIFN